MSPTAADRERAPHHERRYRVRFDECGPDWTLRTSGLLRFAQDVAWVHSDAAGFDRAWYAARGLAWLVRAAEVAVVGPVPPGGDVTLTTEVIAHRRVWARRRAEVRLPDGELAAWVHTDWLMTDGNGAIARIPSELAAFFPGPPTSDQIIRVGLPVEPSGAVATTIRVRPHELDPNDHPNNATYVDWFEEAVLAADPASGAAAVRGRPRHYRLEYTATARAGETLRATTWRDGDGRWCQRIVDRSGADVFRATLATIASVQGPSPDG